MKRIVLTGGGTAGHVTPNIALLPHLKKLGYDIQYIGSYDGIEKKLIEELGISYHGISSGKLRRYFDIKNFSDPFRVAKGFFPGKTIVKTIKTRHYFLKGWICYSACRTGGKSTAYSGYSSRIRHDAWAGKPSRASRGLKNML